MKDLKEDSQKYVYSRCYLVDSCIDNESILNGKKISCKNCSLPIHMKCVVTFGWRHNNFYYCCHDFMIGEKINVDCYPFEFVTMFEDGD